MKLKKDSVILSTLQKWIDSVYSLLIGGFFGTLLTSYTEEEKALRSCRLFSYKGKRGSARLSDTVRLKIARLFENSFFVGRFEEFLFSLLYYRLKTYGAFFLSLGSYGMLSFVLRQFAVPGTESVALHLPVCVAFLLISFPLIASGDTLASALVKSKLLSPIMFSGLGVPRDTFTRGIKCPKHYGVATALGMVLGALTYFVDPIYYPITMVVLLAVTVISQFPELGIITWIALLPFSGFLPMPTAILAFVVLVTGISYLVKLIRGKRVFRMRLIDAAVALLMLLYLVGGIVSVGGMRSLASAMIYVVFLMGYFLVVNLMRTREWVNRAIGTAVLSGTAVCLVGVVQIFVGEQNTSWLDTSLFSDITVRITAGFGNPNIFAEYLLLLIPFAVAFAFGGHIKRSMGSVVALVVMLLCLVFTFSRGAWLGFLIGSVLFFMMLSRRSILGMLGMVLALPVFTWLIPDVVLSRFLSIGNLSESSTAYRISAWSGVGELLEKTLFCGIGVGNAAFSEVYPGFAYAGIERLEHAHSLYLQLLVELGIPGLLVFLLIVFLFVQSGFEYLLKVKSAEGKRLVCAAISALAAMLVMGITDHIWYHYGIFLAFWTMLALTGAHIGIGMDERGRQESHERNTDSASTLVLDMNTL